MKNIKLYYTLWFFLMSQVAMAQELPEYEWWSLPLMNKPSMIQSYPMFHGYMVGWRPKGWHAQMQLLDGIDFNAPISMAPAYQWFRHLQFSSQPISFNKDYTERSLLRNSSTPYLQYALHNTITKNTSMFQLKTEGNHALFHWGINGVLLKKWDGNDWLGPQQQQGLQWFITNHSKNKLRWIIQNSINHQMNAVQSSTAKEVYDIVKTSEYNPNWGWYHGQMLFANTKELSSLVTQFTIEKKWNPSNWIQWSVASVFLNDARQSLTWTKARDPRPDYYKYLPSYQKDSASYWQLFHYLSGHPQKLQYDFDQIENVNKQSSIGRSKYVIDRNTERGYQQRMAFLWHRENKHHFVFHSRMQIGWDINLVSHRLVDLLGGSQFSNRLQWINEGESGNDFAANIDDTSNVALGDKWGPAYRLENKSLQSHNEISWRWSHGEWSMEWWEGIQQMSRSSPIQNQLYQNSKTQKVLPPYWHHMVATRSTYMFNGRWYLNGLLQVEQIPPNASNVFVDPEIQAGLSSFSTPTLNEMHLLSLVHKGITLDAQIDMYQQFGSNINGHHSFYHDYYNAFVYGTYGRENVMMYGVDMSIEKDWYGIVKTSFLTSFKKEAITNNPVYEIRNVNDMFKMESGQLLLKGLPYTNSASLYFASSFEYKPSLHWQFTLDHIWSDQRPVNYNYFRRTDWVKQHTVSDSAWQLIQKVDHIPSVQVLQGAIIHNRYTKQKSKILKWQWKGQFAYFLGNVLPPMYVNESSRFDYNGFAIKKFPSKWLLTQPWLIHLSILFQIQ